MHKEIVFLCISFLVLVNSQTTPFIKQVFLGKCYQRNPSGNVNCSFLWENFSEAAEMDNYKVQEENYSSFISLSNFSSPPDKAMLWEGSQENAAVFSGSDNSQFTILEDTSTGFILSGLEWCGTPDNTFDYTNKCQFLTNTSDNYFGMQGVWNLCAQQFANGVSGQLTILLQPSQLFPNESYVAYRNASVLAHALPNLSTTKVTSIKILLLSNLTLAPYEVCTNGSVVNLTHTLTDLGFKQVSCTDDNEEIYKILCPPQATNTPQCLAALLAQTTKMPKEEMLFLVWALITSVAAGALLTLSVYFGLRVRMLETNYGRIQ